MIWLHTREEKKIKIKILAHFCPIFNFELNGKSSRAEPSWKSFSSSSGSSQFGSDSSLIFSTYFWFTNFASLGLRTLQIHGFEMVPKIFELWGFYADFHRSNTNVWVTWIFMWISTDFVPTLCKFKVHKKCFSLKNQKLAVQIVAPWHG